MQRWVRLSGPILSVLLVESISAKAAPWRDPSPHTVRFVTVDDGVRLEVLDWGGSGRPVVLLAGGGNTAHVFDDFAPKLATHYRVYGITRRGCGASGFAESPNPVDRLRDDLLSALDVLGLDSPVLAGHSIAGAEMSAIAHSQPLRIGGLVYLDAAYPYAFDDGTGPAMREFTAVEGLGHPTPRAADLKSFVALQEWDERVDGFCTCPLPKPVRKVRAAATRSAPRWTGSIPRRPVVDVCSRTFRRAGPTLGAAMCIPSGSSCPQDQAARRS
jgi:pimeloyl-ACP methyl ester carboxylesterase